MPIVSTCPVCGGGRSFVHIDGDDEELTLAGVGSSRTKLSHGRILRCRDCRFAFRRFRPSGSELAALYRDADVRIYEDELPYRARTALTYRRIVTRSFRTPGSILDVGCASGLFLKAMADAGWDVYGVEPSVEQFRLARETLGSRGTVVNTTLERAGFDRRFDAVTFWDVLEHMPEPVAFLSLCASLLAPGGRVFFTVPNLDSWAARLMKGRWPMLLAEPLNHFNPSSARLCARRAGLRVESFGRRAVWFSADYVLYRLAQHGFPLAGPRRLLRALGLGRLALPVYMGDMLCHAVHAP
jgi:2-polyprenyl-3-methyl-5-hydroxy-6-metoxy-1,4-benzoquinol methylase